MIRRILLLGLILIGCSAREDPVSEEWARLGEMEHSWRSLSGDSRLDARQAWLDELRHFVENHPDHPEAAVRYDDEETDFATQLAANGRYDEALDHFRSVLSRNPGHGAARSGLESARKFTNRTEQLFAVLEPGDSQEIVSEKVGLPRSGWTRRIGKEEIWYYELSDGTTLAVRFVDGTFRRIEFPSPGRDGED